MFVRMALFICGSRMKNAQSVLKYNDDNKANQTRLFLNRSTHNGFPYSTAANE